MTTIERILLLIEKHKISIYRLEKDCDIGRSSVRSWKIGRANPSADAIVKLAKYFGVSTDYLLGVTENMDDDLHELIKLYNQLDPDQQKKLLQFARDNQQS